MFLQKSVSGDESPPEVQIRYVDSASYDIFSPSHDGQNGYWMDSVRIYDYENGIKTLIYQPTTIAIRPDYPYGYLFDTGTNTRGIQGAYLLMFANADVVKGYSNSIIQVKDGLYDTLKVHLIGNYSHGFYDSVWYNSVYKPTGANGGVMTSVK